MTVSSGVPFRQNRLLASLPLETVERLALHFQPVTLTVRDVLFHPGDAMPDIYFPLSGMVSLIEIMANGTSLETRLIGREGMLPLTAFLGVQRSPRQALIQAGGQALRVPVAVLREQARERAPLRDLLERYAAATLLHTAQTTACNGLHLVEARLARWLLQALDRVEAPTLPMSHRLLGIVLGVRRASITTAAATLQRAGLIRSLHARVEIVDRPGLEAVACECYGKMRRATDEVFAGTQRT